MSEFAGVPADVQRSWIRDGLRILRGHGLNPQHLGRAASWLRRNTLAALSAPKAFLYCPTDLRARPFLRRGVTWIPQQLWGPVEKSSRPLDDLRSPEYGLLTARSQACANFCVAHSAQFTSVDHVLFRIQPATLTLAERIQADVALRRFKTSRCRQRSPGLSLRSSKST